MDEYAFEIHVPDSNAREGWACKDDTQKIEATDEHEAQAKASERARQLIGGSSFKTRNLRLIRRGHNPDGEI